jgi:prepilin-type N-terminal cleavage/methylation domain-containing protein
MLLVIKNKKSGFSLFELVLAIAIFALSSYALATLLIDSNISAQVSLERTEALYHAKEGIEATRAIRDNSWADLVDGTYGLDSSGGTWAFSGSSDLIDDKYTRTVEITTDPVLTSTKDITVNVEWALTSRRVVNVSLSTILTNWRGGSSAVVTLPFVIYDGSPLYIHPTDNAVNTVWGCYGTAIGASAQSTTDGAGNTAAIVAGCSESDIAAKICSDLSYGGYSDWYLPAIDQLSAMAAQKDTVDKGSYTAEWVDFASGVYYWSSSETVGLPDTYSSDVYFSTGATNVDGKNGTVSVRCVR